MHWLSTLASAALLASLTFADSLVNTPCTTRSASTRGASVPTRYVDSTTTITHAAAASTTTIFKTVTKRKTVSAARVTIKTTRTANTYLPSAHTTITTTTTYSSHSTIYTSTIVPTSAGFLGVLDTLPDSSFSAPQARKRAAKALAARLPAKVTCTKATTVFAQQRPVTVTKTLTSTSTIHSGKPVTVRSTITTTSTHRSTITYTNLRSTTTTLTSTSTTTTIYNACTPSASNLVNMVTFGATSYTFSNAPTRNSSVIFEDYTTPPDQINAYDCCQFCLSEPSCAFVSYFPDLDGSPSCVRLTVQADSGFTCDAPDQYTGGTATSGDVQIQLSIGSPGNQVQIMNGNCGQWTAADSPS